MVSEHCECEDMQSVVYRVALLVLIPAFAGGLFDRQVLESRYLARMYSAQLLSSALQHVAAFLRLPSYVFLPGRRVRCHAPTCTMGIGTRQITHMAQCLYQPCDKVPM